MKKVRVTAPTRGDRNIAWIEEYLRVPEGKNVGKSVVLRPWQRKVIKDIYDSPTRLAIISFGRKNGKTALAAFLLLLHLVGPEAIPNSQLFSAAQSRDQAAILFMLAAKMVRMSPDLAPVVSVVESTKKLECTGLGSVYRALSADASTAYGLSPCFVVHDELGQVKGPRSSLYDALETAVAAQDSPLSVVISTQAPTDADLLSVLIDDAKTGADPRTKLAFFTAPTELDPFSDEAIIAANPAFGDFQNEVEVRAMAETARRQPSRESEYRNLILNQRVEANSPFVSPSVWKANGAEPLENWSGLQVYAGLDLSETSDLTALVLMAQHGGKWHVRPVFWLPGEGLAEKSRHDRVTYDVWARDGQLETTPGRSIEYEYVAARLRSIFDEMDVRAVAFDRFNIKFLMPWLVKAGFSEEEMARFIEFGQGFASMSPALRTLESALLEEKLCHGMHPVLTMCAANAVVTTDPAGNRKFTKARSRGRIDGMVSLAMAVSVAETHEGAAKGSIYDEPSLWAADEPAKEDEGAQMTVDVVAQRPRFRPSIYDSEQA